MDRQLERKAPRRSWRSPTLRPPRLMVALTDRSRSPDDDQRRADGGDADDRTPPAEDVEQIARREEDRVAEADHEAERYDHHEHDELRCPIRE